MGLASTSSLRCEKQGYSLYSLTKTSMSEFNFLSVWSDPDSTDKPESHGRHNGFSEQETASLSGPSVVFWNLVNPDGRVHWQPPRNIEFNLAFGRVIW